MGISVPSNFVSMLKAAAAASGIPYNVVAAQINLESGFNPGATSPTGAEGIAQFEPGTFATYGSGSAYNAADDMAAYAKYMKALLLQEGGNLRNALAAYNAGPGNIAAGMGYADQILNAAGQGNITVGPAGKGGGSSGGAPSTSLADQILGWITDPVKEAIGITTSVGDSLAAVGKEFAVIAKFFEALMNPGTWIRIAAALAGAALTGIGLIILFRVDKAIGAVAKSVPVPIPV